MKLEDFVKIFKGKVIAKNNVTGVWWNGPTSAPENALFIPLDDLGYNPENGIFRISLAPDHKNILEK